MYVIILASGGSTRFGGIIPKQICKIDNKLVIEHNIDFLLELEPQLIKIIIITNVKCIEVIENLINSKYSIKQNKFIIILNNDINSHRLDSLELGLKYLESLNCYSDSKIMIHDVARPYLTGDDCKKLIDEMNNDIVYIQYCVKIDGGLINNKTFEFVNRDDYLEITTPLIIKFNILKEIYYQYLSKDINGIRHNYEFIPFIKEKNYLFKLILGNYKKLRKITIQDDLE